MTAAARVRKARWPATVACGHHVNVGDVIVRRGGVWVCRPCALEAVRAQTSAATAATATEGTTA
jgi:hypothetical protein